MANREEFITEFIEIYRQHRALWQIKSKLYADRRLREIGYQKLLDLYKTVDPEANLDSVKKKINNLRSTFRKELKKVKKSKKSGNSTDGIYKPALWYFNLMLFTADQEESREAIANDDDESQDTMDAGETEVSDFEDASSPQTPQNATENATHRIQTYRPSSAASTSEQSQSSTPTPSTSKSTSKRPKSNNIREELMLKVGKQLEMSEDEFDITGRHIANKLRNLPKHTAIISEKLIMDILYEAQLGNISRTSKLITHTVIPENNQRSACQSQDNRLWSHPPSQWNDGQQQWPQQQPPQAIELNEFLNFNKTSYLGSSNNNS